MCLTGFADWTSRVCVNICPSNPSMFSFVSGLTRICVLSCNFTTTSLFGDAQANRSCVPICSALPTPTFGQTSNSLCVDNCTNTGEYADTLHVNRRCVALCTQTPQTYSYIATKRCVQTCPDNYYGHVYSAGTQGVCAIDCPLGFYGDPISHLCVDKCPTNYYGNPLSGRPCVLKCPLTYYGQTRGLLRICVPTTCDSGYWSDEMTRLCINV
jgi:hypothetical protein